VIPVGLIVVIVWALVLHILPVVLVGILPSCIIIIIILGLGPICSGMSYFWRLSSNFRRAGLGGTGRGRVEELLNASATLSGTEER
jgi:hypothetical protein